MKKKEYISTLVSRMRFTPQTIEDVVTLKTHIYAEFLEQDMALNEIMQGMVNEQIQAREKEASDMEFKAFLERTEMPI